MGAHCILGQFFTTFFGIGYKVLVPVEVDAVPGIYTSRVLSPEVDVTTTATTKDSTRPAVITEPRSG